MSPGGSSGPRAGEEVAPPAGRTGPPAAAAAHFGDLLDARVAARHSQVVLGLDPDPEALWPEALAAAPADGTPAARAAAAVAEHCARVIEAAGAACVAVKLQLACFERLGTDGWLALERTAERARDAGLLVIADAKRGDIDVSAAAYAAAFIAGAATPFGRVEGLAADALTVNPLLGADSLAPFAAAARAAGAGLFVLVRTSNPGARDIQELELADGGDVSERLAGLVDALGEAGSAGLAHVGAVVGATAPERLERLRELMPRAVLLLPGIGAQGGRVEDLAAAFAPGPAGGLVTASRSIAAAHEKAGGEPAVAARTEAERLRELAWGIAA